MKLWQKILILSLLGIFIAVEGTAVTVSWSGFHRTINRTREQTAAAHNNVSAVLINRILFERLRRNEILMRESEVFSVVRGILQGEEDLIVLYDEKEAVCGRAPSFLDHREKFREDAAKAEGCLVLITEDADSVYCVAGSSISLEGRSYSLFSVRDISELYAQRGEELRSIGRISLLFAAGISLIMTFVIFWVLKPLRRINTLLKRIAGGHYSLRVKERGSVEFRTLASNINIMAESIEEHVERLQRIADDRKQFIDSLAHEMKTPLTSIMGFADILRIKRIVGEQERQEYADIIVKEAQRLRALSGKILELATTDNVALDLEEVSVPALFSDVETTVRPIFEKRHMVLTIECEQLSVHIDRELFQSLLYNLLDNAVKASDDGCEIRLSCRRVDGITVFSVSDDGIGMSKQHVRRVTEPFYMVDKSRSRKNGGAGLGLSLCLEIAKRHNARLVIHSQPGRGTRVDVRMEGGESA